MDKNKYEITFAGIELKNIEITVMNIGEKKCYELAKLIQEFNIEIITILGRNIKAIEFFNNEVE